MFPSLEVVSLAWQRKVQPNLTNAQEAMSLFIGGTGVGGAGLQDRIGCRSGPRVGPLDK